MPFPHRKASRPIGVAGWIVICAFFSCAGWILSVCHQLNAGGYVVAILFGASVVFALRRKITPSGFSAWNWPRLRRRFGRLFPCAFLILAFLTVAGGVLYRPSNYDGLAYRMPRVLHWLADGRWHWIHTEFNRLNTRAPGAEWLSAPIVALTGSDRLTWILSVISLLLLPGLVFAAFRAMGVAPRVAWHWMWLAPTGYCFLLESGGIANDSLGAVFALAAIYYALRARLIGCAGDLWLSMLAAGLMTGIKAVSIPLALPVLAAMLPSLRLLRGRILATIGVALTAATASFLPSAIMNLRHSPYPGDWSGVKAEHAEVYEGKIPIRIANNCVLLTIQDLAPPLFPMANGWNDAVKRWMPAGLRASLEGAFEPGGAHWVLGEMQIEEEAGLGFGVTALLLASLAAGAFHALRHSPSVQGAGPRDLLPRAVLLCVCIAFLAFMAKSGLTTVARLVTPYFLPLMPVVLAARSQDAVVRSKWWMWAAIVVFAMAGVLVILSPARPLWPANYVLARMDVHGHRLLERARTVYGIQAIRWDALAPARELLPPDTRRVGLISADDPETSLWRPFGRRRIAHVMAADSPEYCRAEGIEYVLVNTAKFPVIIGQPFDDWVARMRAQIVAEVTIKLKGQDPPCRWVLVKLGAHEANG